MANLAEADHWYTWWCRYGDKTIDAIAAWLWIEKYGSFELGWQRLQDKYKQWGMQEDSE